MNIIDGRRRTMLSESRRIIFESRRIIYESADDIILCEQTL